jgi:hypothetical protein
MGIKLSIGDEIYVVVAVDPPQHPNGHLNVYNYVSVSAQIIEIEKKIVTVVLESGKQFDLVIDACFNSRKDADQFRYRIVFNHLKELSIYRIEHDTPKYLLPNFEPRFTGNVLRYGERNIIWNLPDWNEIVTEEKILQLIALTVEDVEILISLLEIMIFTNDYAKKLIGKYSIIELSNLYTLLRGGNGSKGLRNLNKEYAKNEFLQLEDKINKLESNYKFRDIRNKLVAHKDCNVDFTMYNVMWSKINIKFIEEYWQLITVHLEEILTKYYPEEKVLYFLLPKQSIPSEHDDLISETMKTTMFPFDDDLDL